MSMSSVTSTQPSPGTPGTDSTGPECGIGAPVSGFEQLLAVHADTRNARAQDSASDPNGDQSGRQDRAECAAGPDPAADAPPKPKTDRAADAEALAAELAAQGAAPVAPPPADPITVADLLAASTVAPADASASEAAPTADGTGAAAAEPVDLPAPTVQTELASLLLAAAPTDPPPAPPPSTPITPLFDNRAADESRPPEKTAAPDPVAPAPGLAPTDPMHDSRPRTTPAAAANAFVAGNAPAAPVSTAAVHTPEVAATVAAEPPPPAEQLVSILTPLRTSPNGTYTLRLELKPAELGRVEMRVEMRDGVLHASIHADRESSAQLVRASLNELRDQLAAEGVHTGSLTVSDGALGSSARDGDARQANAGGSRRDAAATGPEGADDGRTLPAPTELPSTFDSDSASLLDVRV